MSALVIRRRSPRQLKQGFVPCHNRCRAVAHSKGGVPFGADTGFKQATWNAQILGHDTPLCTTCARSWKRMWDEALDTAAEAEQVAA